MPVVHRRGEAESFGDTSIPWGATLVQPERMIAGSRQVVVVDVTGPRPLEGRVRVHVGRSSEEGRWEGSPSTSRRVVAPIRPSPGVHHVLIRLEGGPGEAPLLEAGKIIVASP